MSEHGKAMYVQRFSYLSFVCWLEGLGFAVVVWLALRGPTGDKLNPLSLSYLKSAIRLEMKWTSRVIILSPLMLSTS